MCETRKFHSDAGKVRLLLKAPWEKHDIYQNHFGKEAPVACHSEIKESLCELIKNQPGSWIQARSATT